MAHVLIIGDTHCPAMRRGYVPFLKRIQRKYGCTRIVHIGDLLDFSFLGHYTSYANLNGGSREFASARRQVQSLVRAFPNVDWVLGNHDLRLKRALAEKGLDDTACIDYASLLGCDRSVIKPDQRLIIDGVLYRHGDEFGSREPPALHAAKQSLCSVVIGHHHTQGGVNWYVTPDRRIFGLSVGTGINTRSPHFDYAAGAPKRPIVGCGVVLNGSKAFFEPCLL